MANWVTENAHNIAAGLLVILLLGIIGVVSFVPIIRDTDLTQKFGTPTVGVACAIIGGLLWGLKGCKYSESSCYFNKDKCKKETQTPIIQ